MQADPNAEPPPDAHPALEKRETSPSGAGSQPESAPGDLPTRRRAAPGSISPGPRNIRFSSHVQKLFGLLLLLILLLAFYYHRIYQTEIKPALALVGSGASQTADSAEPQPDKVARAIGIQLPADARRQIEETAAKNTELQRQLDSVRSLQQRQEQQMQKLIEQIATAAGSAPPPAAPASASPSAPHLSTSDAAGVTTDAPATSPFDEPQSPALAELRLMKERNRLTAYADEAISTGARRPLGLIVEAMQDPERATLYHAAKAEYYRIMGHYQLINRIDPAYKLPLAELFPGGKVRDEADLSTTQIIDLLKNKDIDWQPRLRAAFLLGGRRTPEVGDALIKTLKEDPHLDVAKEAQLSFEQNVGRNFLLFDIPGIDAWWRAQAAEDTPQQPANATPEN